MTTIRREHKGAAAFARLASGIGTTDDSVDLDDATGWPTGAVGPFYFVIDQGDTTEEKCRATSRAGDTLTGVTRAQDDTSAANHSANAPVEHIWTATEVAEFNAHTAGAETDPHGTQLLNNARHDVGARHAFGGALGTPSAPADIGTVSTAGAGDDPAREDHGHKLGAGSINSPTLFAPGAVDQAALGTDSVGTDELQPASVGASELQDNLGLGALGYGDDATALTNDSPVAANTWEQWGPEELTFTTPLVPIVVRGSLVGNLNGDGLAQTRTGESRIEVSLDGGSTWEDVGNNGPTGEVSATAGDSRDGISSLARITGTPTGAVVVRAALRSDGTSMVFANGYLMAEWRVDT